MEPKHCIYRLLPKLLLTAVLMAAQLGAVLHAFAHEPGAPQTTVCATCIAAEKLSAAAVDVAPCSSVSCLRPSSGPILNLCYDSKHALTARQRGPPALG